MATQLARISAKLPTFRSAAIAASMPNFATAKIPSFQALTAQLSSGQRVAAHFTRRADLMRQITEAHNVHRYIQPPTSTPGPRGVLATKPQEFDVRRVNDDDLLMLPGIVAGEILRRGMLPPPGTN